MNHRSSLSKGLRLVILLVAVLLLSGCATENISASKTTDNAMVVQTQKTIAQTPQLSKTTPSPIDENGAYTTKEDVSAYLHIYNKLPSNFITKKQAQALGWPGGDLRPYAPDKCIGGDRFGNYEGLLPKKSGRQYYECDIDTLGASSRGPKRIVFSNDGLIFYTGDHYKTFEQLYGGN